MTVTGVTKNNLKDILPDFKKHLEACQFVAIDAEYSGLRGSQQERFNLCDTPEVRYQKMRAGGFKIIQFGIALFKFDERENNWHPVCYNFAIFPPAFEADSITETIPCQASSLIFLRKHNFDFNKWISEGIPYLNIAKASKVKRYLNNHKSILCSGSMVDKEVLSFSKSYHRIMRESSNLTDDDINELLDDLRGFSHIVDEISKSHKYVVGHNVYTDLLLTYQQFHNDLPETYAEFKRKLNGLFPKIFDTKRIAFAMQNVLAQINSDADVDSKSFDPSVLSDTNLFSLHFHTQLKEKLSPKIVSDGDYKTVLEQSAKQRIENIPNALCHEAAFDACVTGSVFIQLAYLLQRPSLQFQSLHSTAGELIFGCSRWLNMVNATRCSVPYINLAGEDPSSHRPEPLILIGHKRGYNLLSKLDWLQRNLPKFGDYDVRIDEDKIIVACGNNGCSLGIRRYLTERGYIFAATSDETWKQFVLKYTPGLNALSIGIGSGLIIGIIGGLWWGCR